MIKKNTSICVIGLGYVGLPLANELSKKYTTYGFDINKKRINSLKKGIDLTNEIKKINKKLFFTSNLKDIKNCNFYIICLPTPVNIKKKPDLQILNSALKKISSIITKKDILVFESTYYPGATEELVKNNFKKSYNELNIGYSPERINPGDKKNTINKITKVISANNSKTLLKMSEVYGSINNNKIYKAKNIRVAEAAKLIENVQRDINIGLINELTKIFYKLNVSIHDVLNASETKWNFLKFKPGLVGGHCIGIDPYYLKFLCERINFKPKVFMSARETNEDMSFFYKKKITKHINKNDKVLFLGVSFKENTNDLRNSKNLELLKMISKNKKIYFYDPHVKKLEKTPKNVLNYKKQFYDTIIFVVPHKKLFKFIKNNLKSILKTNGNLIDLNKNLKFIGKKNFNYISL
jgi:UDP-N-acetyl-D-galactosamine dehydrogenase